MPWLRNSLAAGQGWSSLHVAEEVADCEPDAALGNGGLPCRMLSGRDGHGRIAIVWLRYRYEYGMFAQEIQDGRQMEYPDRLKDGTLWEFPRPTSDIRFVLALADYAGSANWCSTI
jgi:starch phosphorylase